MKHTIKDNGWYFQSHIWFKNHFTQDKVFRYAGVYCIIVEWVSESTAAGSRSVTEIGPSSGTSSLISGCHWSHWLRNGPLPRPLPLTQQPRRSFSPAGILRLATKKECLTNIEVLLLLSGYRFGNKSHLYLCCVIQLYNYTLLWAFPWAEWSSVSYFRDSQTQPMKNS